MNRVYLVVPNTRDEVLGHVDVEGKVFRRKVGRDDLVGRVDLASGRIFEHRFGPDKRVGRVDLSNGKVYTSRLGPDKYVGRVEGDGRMFRPVALATDELVGKVGQFLSYAHAAGAFLLLVLPALDIIEASEAFGVEAE